MSDQDIELRRALVRPTDDGGYFGELTVTISGGDQAEIHRTVAALDELLSDFTPDETATRFPPRGASAPETAEADGGDQDGEDVVMVCDKCGEEFTNPTKYGGHVRWCGVENTGKTKPPSAAERERDKRTVISRDIGEIGRLDVHEDVWLDDDDVLQYEYGDSIRGLNTGTRDYNILYHCALYESRHGAPFTSTDVREEFDINRNAVTPALTMLRGVGAVEKVGQSKSPIEYRVSEGGWKYLDYHGPPTDEFEVADELSEEFQLPEEYESD